MENRQKVSEKDDHTFLKKKKLEESVGFSTFQKRFPQSLENQITVYS